MTARYLLWILYYLSSVALSSTAHTASSKAASKTEALILMTDAKINY